MRKFGVPFDSFYRESSLLESGYFATTIEALRGAGQIEDRHGSVWLRSDDKSGDTEGGRVRKAGVWHAAGGGE